MKEVWDLSNKGGDVMPISQLSRVIRQLGLDMEEPNPNPNRDPNPNPNPDDSN